MTEDEARELAMIDSPTRPETPTADDVKVMMRSQNIRLSVGGLAMLGLMLIVVWYAAESAASSRDSNNSTQVQLAAQNRNACITARRNEQSDALGRLNIAANNAEAAGLIDNDEKRVAEERALYELAVDDWIAATESLSPEVLNQAPEDGGCGPPILTLDDLDPDEGR